MPQSLQAPGESREAPPAGEIDPSPPAPCALQTLAERVGDQAGERARGRSHPSARAFATVAAGGYAAVTALMIALGLLLTHGPLSGSIGGRDDWATSWLADRRSGAMDGITKVLSLSADTIGAIGIALVVAIVFAFGRRWQAIAALVVGLTLGAARVPDRQLRGRPSAARRAQDGDRAVDIELSVRSHGGHHRHLRPGGGRGDRQHHARGLAGAGMGRRGGHAGGGGLCPCVPRHAPPHGRLGRASSWGSPYWSSPWPPCGRRRRRRRRLARPRIWPSRPGTASVRTFLGRQADGPARGGRRPPTEVARRRASRAAPPAGERRRRGPRSGSRCRRARRRRSASARRSPRAPSSCSSGAATAWCSAASTPSPAHDATLGILPAGTANLLATNLGIPQDLEEALDDRAARGRDRPVDVGQVNGEHFAVMAGVGFDAQMIDGADSAAKERLGQAGLRVHRRRRHARRPGQGPHQGRRHQVVQGRRQLRAGRQRRHGQRGARRLPRRRARRRRARGRRRHRRGHCAVVAGPRRRPPRKQADRSPFVADDARHEGRRPARARSPSTSSTAAAARRSSASASASKHHARSTSACRRSDEHRPAGPRDVGAHRRRRRGHAPELRASAGCCATRSCGCGSPTASATPDRWPS